MQASEQQITSSPHSRACQSCASSKAKCIPATSETAGKCLRCYKSRRECLIPEKSTKKRKSPGSTTAELEQRIQDLAVILAAQQQAVSKSFPSTPESQVQNEMPSTNRWQANNPVDGFQSQQHLPSIRHNSWGTRALDHPTTESNYMPLPLPVPPLNAVREPSSVARVPPTPGPTLLAKDGDYLLKIYRDHFSRRFPFIIVPPTLSAKELQTQRPWLFKAIAMVASQDNRVQQLIWAKDLISELAISMLVKGERSLDMLQSLIICESQRVFSFVEARREDDLLQNEEYYGSNDLSYNIWAYTVTLSSPQLASTCHIQMTLAMVYDLGLHRTVGDSELAEMLNHGVETFGSENNRNLATRSMDERRTLLAVYYLTSFLSWSMKKIEGLQYSPYIEHCRQSLLNSAEYESDIVLAGLVKIQSIIDKSIRNISDNDLPGGEKTPVWMLSKLAVLELKAYWASLTSEIRQNSLLATNYQCAEIGLLETCLLPQFFPRDLANGNTHRLNMLHSCLVACQKLLDSSLTQPLSSYFTFCVTDIATMRLGCASLIKLSLVDEVGWDLASVRQNVSVKERLQKIRENLEQVGLAIDQNRTEPCRPSFFTSGAAKMKLVEGWYAGRIAKESQQTNGHAPQDLTGLLVIDNMELYDSRFWEDFMTDVGFV